MRYEYRTEILSSLVGRDKVRMDDLKKALSDAGAEGWQLVTFSPDVNIKGERDGHLLIFQRGVST